MLQYITNTECGIPVAEQIRQVIAGGGRWVQVRMKEASDDEIRKVIEEVMPLCLETECFLLLDDRVELAKELNVGGVHLGKEDMLPSKARMTLGAAAVIGCTANTFADVEAVRYLDVDYIGIGPFRHTVTKKNLAPLLGENGIREIVSRMKQEEITIATVAIGGITLDDVRPLMETGVSGIAVSGDIANAPDIAARTKMYLDILKDFRKD